MSHIFILTDSFPFGKGEDFIANEIEFISKEFDEVYILPSGLLCDMAIKRIVPENVKILNPVKVENLYKLGNPSRKSRFIWSIKNMLIWVVNCLFSKYFYKEVIYLINEKRFKVRNVKSLIFSLAPCLRNIRHFKKVISKEMFDISHNVVYSFWFDHSQLMMDEILRLNNIDVPIKRISRGHRHDIYVEESRQNYLPFRDLYFSKVDYLYLSTQDGFNYMKNKYPKYKDKIKLAYLGTRDHGFKIRKNEDVFRIVSCSFMSPIKRVNLIVDALSSIDSQREIEWVHFGDGLLFNEIVEYTNKKLKNKITYIFKGYTANSEMLDYYGKNTIHLFLNVSASEGLPVSIQEAISFGIPVIATDVGSTREAIKENGFLLHKDFDVSELSGFIKIIMDLPNGDYIELCRNSRKLWEERFNANTVYGTFFKSLASSKR